MFALVSFAGVSLIRRNRRRTILTIFAVASATLVFCTVMVAPYITERIAAAGGDEQVCDALRTSRIVLPEN
jgi:hypothetical protein